jgi:hypothetical protein
MLITIIHSSSHSSIFHFIGAVLPKKSGGVKKAKEANDLASVLKREIDFENAVCIFDQESPSESNMFLLPILHIFFNYRTLLFQSKWKIYQRT